MADYIYLLENRLSAAQRASLHLMRELAADKLLTLFLVGGAVRDLTSGSPVRDLDFLVQGNALSLRSSLEEAGAEITGEQTQLQTLYLTLPGDVRAEVGSTLGATWPKPGEPVYQSATLGEDLRRRDFTANAMALSLNEGSYGLLIDPLNGVADIENRQVRLVSNYGFLEEPVRMIRAARLMARLGWTLEEKTALRYESAQQENYIGALSKFQRGYELEEIFHEEDPLRVLRRLEAEGWMKHLAAFWTTARINTAEVDRLRETQLMLQLQGIVTEGGAAVFPLLTAKMSAKEQATLKASFPRQGFVRQIDALEGAAKEFIAQLSGKSGSSASGSYKLILSAKPEAVLQGAFTSRSPAVQAKFKAFSAEWPQVRQRIPYALMQEMRITPELDGYDELVDKIFFELIDGRLNTPEEMRAFLEPYSPPAPPPPVNLRRTRSPKKDAKTVRSRAKKGKAEEDQELDGSGFGEAPAERNRDDFQDQSHGMLDKVRELPEHDQDEAKDAPAPEAISAPQPAGKATGSEPRADGAPKATRSTLPKEAAPAPEELLESAKETAKPVQKSLSGRSNKPTAQTRKPVGKAESGTIVSGTKKPSTSIKTLSAQADGGLISANEKTSVKASKGTIAAQVPPAKKTVASKPAAQKQVADGTKRKQTVAKLPSAPPPDQKKSAPVPRKASREFVKAATKEQQRRPSQTGAATGKIKVARGVGPPKNGRTAGKRRAD